MLIIYKWEWKIGEWLRIKYLKQNKTKDKAHDVRLSKWVNTSVIETYIIITNHNN